MIDSQKKSVAFPSNTKNKTRKKSMQLIRFIIDEIFF